MSDAEPEPGRATPDALGRLAAGSGLKRNDAGNIDVLASIGGVRGLVEALGPGLVFLAVFIVAQSLNPALIASVAVGVVLLVARLVTRATVMPAVSGLVGIIVCALFARVGGQARDYYVPGFFINAAYIVALAVSALVRWPLLGIIFGMLRGEEVRWRASRRRMRLNTAATWLVTGVLALRLVVQVPLYFADQVAALGTARLVMGTPLYIGAIALAWVMTRQPKDDAAGAPSGEPRGD